MAFSLIEQSAGAVPIVAIGKDRLPGWLDEAPERERNWVTSLGFSAEAGKHALLPDETGRLARVLVGLGDADAEGTMWALAGLPEALPEGSYRLEAVRQRRRPHSARARLGARHLLLHPLQRETPARRRPRLARGSRSRPCRAAGPRGVPRP